MRSERTERTESSLAAAALAALASLVVAPADAAENVVLESNTNRFTVGQTLDSEAPLTLGANEVVVLAMEDGRTLVVEGPHDGPAAGQPPTESRLRRLVAQLFGTDRPEIEGLGGVRGGAERTSELLDTRPDPWLIHTGLTSEQCVLASRPVELWREEDQGRRSTIVDVSSGESAELEWRDRNRAEWPFQAAPADDRVYLFRPDDELRSTAIRLHTLAAGLADKGLTTVAWLAARGCTAQARLLLQSLPEPKPAP
ncbi:MAG TPA: hypothetical protein VFV10_18670 [Gammaproteobacteria bacterium]|nr:hypothetical protein [Gammaproteobacteria bacterium]